VSNNKKKYPGISRIDSKHTHGWYVRVYANGGVFTSKLFSDRLYGGKQIALNNAIKYRDHNKMVAELHKREGRNPNRRPFYNKAPKNNQSGVVGVNEVKTTIRGREVHYFQATWSADGKANSRKFYVSKKRTREEAEKQAIALRQEKVKMLQKSWKVMLKEDLKWQKELKKKLAKQKK
jgi:hypothetical protein